MRKNTTDCSVRNRKQSEEKIIGDYNTIFGRAIVLIPERQYQIGDQIDLPDGNYRITQIIQPSRPMKDGRISLALEKLPV